MTEFTHDNLAQQVTKCPTGIQGFDEISFGGLPQGRTALICGAAGCGKTMMAMQFLVNGATLYNEPGVFISFEETEEELAQNFASLGICLPDLIAGKKLYMDYIYFDKSEIAETGEYDLDGLFVRIDYAIKSVGAKRVVLDTIEALFSGLSNTTVLRAELRRLFRMLKERGVTAIVTGEKGDGTLTRHGIEEYVSDCVVLLDHKVIDQISTRRLRIIKYRGSAHGTNEYPFLIDEQGICVMPITSIGLNAKPGEARISTGIARLDTMLGGEGLYQGSSVLISGTAGTGKTSLGSHMAAAACARGERCIYFGFEESMHQIIRNMKSIGISLDEWVAKGLLKFQNARPTHFGLEMHLVNMYKIIKEFKPQVVIVDPISNLTAVGADNDVKLMITRLLDFLKIENITAILLDLCSITATEQTGIGISSLTDTWISLRDIELNGERNRGLYILKSRGMAHSNQIREYLLTDQGIELLDVYTGSEGVLTGSARYAQVEKEKAQRILRQQDVESKRREIERKRRMMETAIAELAETFEAEKEELEKRIAEEELQIKVQENNRENLATLRKAD